MTKHDTYICVSQQAVETEKLEVSYGDDPIGEAEVDEEEIAASASEDHDEDDVRSCDIYFCLAK